MYQVLRGESLKAVLPRIIVCWVLAAVLLGVGAPGLVKMAAGPGAVERRWKAGGWRVDGGSTRIYCGPKTGFYWFWKYLFGKM